MGQGGHVIDSL